MSSAKITITKETIRWVSHHEPLDPPITVYIVVLSDLRGIWRETFATEVELHAFLRGVSCGASMPELHNISYEVPR
jgi:hypothetical protein